MNPLMAPALVVSDGPQPASRVSVGGGFVAEVCVCVAAVESGCHMQGNPVAGVTQPVRKRWVVCSPFGGTALRQQGMGASSIAPVM